MPQARLPMIIRALLQPSAYPNPADNVDLVQTHISYVLLAGDYVYKIKKAVDFGFVDYSTLGRRRHYCREEVRLNSRLCSDTYLGVVAVREHLGKFNMEGPGRTVEYAVKMRRLPQGRMLDHLLEKSAVSRAMVSAVAERLASFHENTRASDAMARLGDRVIRRVWRENLEQLYGGGGGVLSSDAQRALSAYGEAFFARRSAVLERRVAELRIRECHSDLRSDAVCLTNGVCIFDCVEFSRRLRLVDVARDVGFLAMDLRYRGHPQLAAAFVDAYVEKSRDEDLREVLTFYKSYNACVRAKVEQLLSYESEVSLTGRRAARRASKRYLDLACSYAAELPPALLVITCGLPGTGKSTFARSLAERTAWTVFSSDVVRKEQAGVPLSEHRYEAFGKGIYSPDATDLAYAELLARARALLLDGRSVILDASFIRRRQRRAAARLAQEAGAQFACVLLEARDSAVHSRISRRIAMRADPSDARWEIYVAQKRRFQRPSEVPPERSIALDSRRRRATNATYVLRQIRAISPLSKWSRRPWRASP